MKLRLARLFVCSLSLFFLFQFQSLPAHAEVAIGPSAKLLRGNLVSKETSLQITKNGTSSILYVKVDGSDVSCSSWTNSCDLQTALGRAVYGDEIWVAEGTYLPTTTTDRSISFQLKSGVKVYGGFSGLEVSRDERDWEIHSTILSGDINVAGEAGDNSYSVVTGLNLSSATVLDGFTITAGRADGEFRTSAGGVDLEASNPVFTNLIIRDNFAASGGGGMYNSEGSPTMNNVQFIDNIANWGGGLVNGYFSYPVLIDCLFTGNIALTSEGGGMVNWYGFPTLRGVLFTGNSAVIGGAISNSTQGSPTLINVTITNNSASDKGGGIYNWWLTKPNLINVTMTRNSAPIGAGIFNEDQGCYSPTCENEVSITNSIIWDNIPDQIYIGSENVVTATYSDIQTEPVFPGIGNINADPMLDILTDNGGLQQTHALLEGSPAIDTADQVSCPQIDQRGYVRPVDGDGDGLAICDMGAFEFGAQLPEYSFLYLPLVLK